MTTTVIAWGFNGYGQLGDGNNSPAFVDVPVKPKLSAATTVTALSAGFAHSLALTSTGAVLAWGYNPDGELGDGTDTGPQSCTTPVGRTPCSKTPVNVKLPKGTHVTAIAAGGLFGLALTSTGAVLAWGDNKYGGLGDGSTATSDVPVTVHLPKATKVTAIAAGYYHSVALTSTGAVLAWGINVDGELGDGNTTGPNHCNGVACSMTPVKVKVPAGTKVTKLVAGSYHTLALTSTGAVLAWGFNNRGQLGDGNTSSRDVPVNVMLPRGMEVTAISAGYDHNLARTSTGAVLAWGDNRNGELGDGRTTQSDVPVKAKLPGGTSVTALAGGEFFSLALTSTGAVLAWGDNADGQLGDGTFTQRDIPVKVKLPNGSKASMVGTGQAASHSLAIVHP